MISYRFLGYIMKHKNTLLETTKKKISQKKASAYTDYLTKLANRQGLFEYYHDLSGNMPMHFMFIDIDNFKRVNDVYGHNMGDQLLIAVAHLLQSTLSDCFISRIGGDEFVAAIDGSMDHPTVTGYAQRLLDDLQEMDFRKDILSLISLSIGIILDQDTTQELDDVLYKCDSAMYHAKTHGKNNYVVYHALEKSVEIAKNIEAEMENALKTGQFEVYFQPRINILTSNVVGAEALVRWNHPVDGIRLPEEFLPIFEKNGFIKPLDLFMYDSVCKIKASWKGTPYEHLPISLNLSRLHLYQKNLPEFMLTIAEEYGVNANEINFEINESVFIKDSIELLNMTERLVNKGFHVSIDNFGSGYSALNMLKDITADYINIDKDFIQLSSHNTKGRKVLKNVLVMCKDLKLNVVATGVETTDHIDFSVTCGCEVAQGNYYCPPVTLDEFISYLDTHYYPNGEYTRFTFDDTFTSDCKKYTGSFIGEGYEFREGVLKGRKSLYLPGGNAVTNYVNLPPTILYHDSYTISIWLKPEVLTDWTSAFYVKSDTGFFSITPKTDDTLMTYRIRDARVISGWYDTMCPNLPANTWSHVTICCNATTEEASLYINGEYIGKTEHIPTYYFIMDIWVGTDIYKPSFQGCVADLIICNRVQTPEEIKAAYLETADNKDFVYADSRNKN